MSWIHQHKTPLRGAALALLIVSLLGPWWFDEINVPAQYKCDRPFIRLEGDYCGLPMPGYWIPVLFFGAIFELVSGASVPENLGAAILAVAGFGLLVALLLLPFFSTLYGLARRDRRHNPWIPILVWVQAAGAALVIGLNLTRPQGSWALWGIWLYVCLAVVATALEVVLLRQQSSH